MSPVLHPVRWFRALGYRNTFRKAARLLEEKGWCQHSGGCSEGPMDVDSAIFNVSFRRPEDLVRYSDLLRVFRVHIGQTQIIKWNDDPMRTKEEVIATLRSI